MSEKCWTHVWHMSSTCPNQVTAISSMHAFIQASMVTYGMAPTHPNGWYPHEACPRRSSRPKWRVCFPMPDTRWHQALTVVGKNSKSMFNDLFYGLWKFYNTELLVSIYFKFNTKVKKLRGSVFNVRVWYVCTLHYRGDVDAMNTINMHRNYMDGEKQMVCVSKTQKLSFQVSVKRKPHFIYFKAW